MSTTVTYKGNTLTTVNNETKSLLTAGTWLEDDIEITDVSSGGSSTALIVDTTDSHGGIIREITTDTEVRLQGRKTVTPTSQTQIITADTGYDGIVEVEVAPSSGGGTPVTESIRKVSEEENIYPDTGYNGIITVSKKPILTNSWDFTDGLVDSVGGLTATLSNGATQSSNGVTITGITQYISFPVYFEGRKTYEIDIDNITKTYSSDHGRFFMINSGEGLIYRSTGEWNVYLDRAWGSTTGGTDITILNGKTLTVKSGIVHNSQSYNGTVKTYANIDFYIDGELWFKTSQGQPLPQVNQYLRIGQNQKGICDVTITGFRIYDGVEY